MNKHLLKNSVILISSLIALNLAVRYLFLSLEDAFWINLAPFLSSFIIGFGYTFWRRQMLMRLTAIIAIGIYNLIQTIASVWYLMTLEVSFWTALAVAVPVNLAFALAMYAALRIGCKVCYRFTVQKSKIS